MFCLSLIEEGSRNTGGWHLVVNMIEVGFGSSGEDGKMVWFASEVCNCVCPNLLFVVVLDAVISHKMRMGEV